MGQVFKEEKKIEKEIQSPTVIIKTKNKNNKEIKVEQISQLTL